MTKPTPKGFNKLEPCPECGRWKTSRHGGGLICTNIRRCSLAISIEDDLAEIDGLRITTRKGKIERDGRI